MKEYKVTAKFQTSNYPTSQKVHELTRIYSEEEEGFYIGADGARERHELFVIQWVSKKCMPGTKIDSAIFNVYERSLAWNHKSEDITKDIQMPTTLTPSVDQFDEHRLPKMVEVKQSPQEGSDQLHCHRRD